jgi:hypothetical protein
MKLQIPDIGDKLTLQNNWSFTLYCEYRNSVLWKIFTDKEFSWQDRRLNKTTEVSLPKNTILIVDRVYIRQGAKDFSSLSFRIESCPNKQLNKKRFWAKLLDVNTMSILLKKNDIPVLDFSDVLKSHKYVRRSDVTDNKAITFINTRNSNEYAKQFKVICTLKTEVRNRYSGYVYIIDIKYILQSLHNAILFETSSYEVLKKKAREIFEKSLPQTST